MSSEENSIKASVTKMVSEDDLTSVAFHFLSFTLLSPVSIYLPELPGTAPVSAFPVFVLLVSLSEYQ